MKTVRNWLDWHSVRMHLLVPVWKRVPEKARWAVVGRLDKSDRFCWADLVDAAMSPTDGDDPCDGRLPLPAGDGPACAKKCDWMHDHAETECACYCGKFKITNGHAVTTP